MRSCWTASHFPVKYRLLISYDGTRYSGWQVQVEALSIQCAVEGALSTALRAPIRIVGAGRTDAGVHAIGQVAHFCFDGPCDPYKLLRSLNALLPPDIRIRAIERADPDFHARYSAVGKIYHYYLEFGPTCDPLRRLWCTHIPYPIDQSLLAQGAALCVGKRDFTSFAHKAHSGSAARGAVRHLVRLDVVEIPGGVCLQFEANGFLHKMVRNLVGTLLDVAKGKLEVHHIPEIFAARDRKRAGQTAPPQGLCLMQVLYAPQPNREIAGPQEDGYWDALE